MNKTNTVFNWLPCAVVFLSTAHQGQRDIMTATAMFVSEIEPLVTISVAKNHLTEQLINRSGKFAIVIAGENQKQLAVQLGHTKGQTVDKFNKFSIESTEETSANASIPEGSAAWMSCDVESNWDIEGYRIFMGRVKEHKDLDAPPLVWQKNNFYGLKSL